MRVTKAEVIKTASDMAGISPYDGAAFHETDPERGLWRPDSYRQRDSHVDSLCIYPHRHGADGFSADTELL